MDRLQTILLRILLALVPPRVRIPSYQIGLVPSSQSLAMCYAIGFKVGHGTLVVSCVPFIKTKSLSTLNRATRLATTFGFASSFPLCYPCHMHASPPTFGNVLQVGASRGLHRPMGAHGTVRLRGGVGIPRPRPLVVVHGTG